MEDHLMEQAIVRIADSAYIAWSDFVDELLRAGMVAYTMPGWTTYLNEETGRFIAWNDDVVEVTISASPHG
jgi:hypothetical protein